MMTMVLPWDRRRLGRETQRRTEEQLANVSDQLMQVGEIIGRLNAVASRFEVAATRIVDAVEDQCPEENDDNGKAAQPGR